MKTIAIEFYWEATTIRKLLVCLLALLLLITPVKTTPATTAAASIPIEGSTEELYQDIFLALLGPSIEQAVDNYYSKYFKHSPAVALYEADILEIERSFEDRTFSFIIKLQVSPYFGPHNSVGIDNITLKIAMGNPVQIEKFEHIKSYALPFNDQQEIINKWPPADVLAFPFLSACKNPAELIY